MKALMSLKEAAAETPYDERVLRQGVEKARQGIDNGKFPPPLKARRGDKRGGHDRILVTDTDLKAWIAALPPY